MEGQPDSQPDQEQLALESFFDYLKQDGEIPDVLDRNLWQIKPYEDGYLISSKTRSNQAFLVQGDRVVEYAPAWKSIEQVYSETTAEQRDGSTGFGDLVCDFDIANDFMKRHEAQRDLLIEEFVASYLGLVQSQINEMKAMLSEGRSKMLFGESSIELLTAQELKGLVSAVQEEVANHQSGTASRPDS